MTSFFLFVALLSSGVGIYCGCIHDPAVGPLQGCLLGAAWLAMGAVAITDTGLNRITFDLRRRTYEGTLYAPPLLGGAADFPGVGNVFAGDTVSGPIEDVEGIQIIGRTGKNIKIYALRLRWKNPGLSPTPIGYFTDRREAREQASEVAKVLSLPVLEIDDRN